MTNTVVCVASGPSLTIAQTQLIEAERADGRCHVIVVNTTWEKLPNADVLYACDLPWWDIYHAEVAAGFRGECWTRDAEAAQKYGLCYIRSEGKPGASFDPAVIYEGSNGGYQSVNLARHFLQQHAPDVAKRIILVAFDMMFGPDGETHHHGNHPPGLANGDPKSWVRNFDKLAIDLAHDGIEVVNCSLRTALTQFRRADLAETLAAE